MSDPDAVLRRLIAWARETEAVRAAVLTGSRAIDALPVDALSDYDVVLYTSDPGSLLDEPGWIQELGPVLLRLPTESGLESWGHPTRLVLYEDGTKIDFTVRSAAALRKAVGEGRVPGELEAGYRVLLDKDELTSGLPAPSRRAHGAIAPNPREFDGVVREFWWESIYVAKNLWREELLPARYSFECVMRQDLLRRMLEWRAMLDPNGAPGPWALGRGLDRRLPTDLWNEVKATCAGADPLEGWQGLFRMTDLFRSVALQVARHHDLEYPHRVDSAVTGYLAEIRDRPR